MTESGPRPLLPQNSQGFTFNTQARPERREPQRNYVFVDEKNRHRRLKVVRACEGCRRRKIKCDAANTNTWPCSACVRLKMNCVPPAFSFDKDDNSDDADAGSFVSNQFYPPQQNQPDIKNEEPFPFGFSAAPTGAIVGNHQLPEQQIRPQHVRTNSGSSPDRSLADGGYDFPHINQAGIPTNRYQSPLETPRSMDSPESTWESEDGSLLSALGDLQISPLAVAPYIVNQRKLAEAPAVQEFETPLPQTTSPDPTVRIPSEMMPSDDIAAEYLRYFFDHIHPYVPVVNPSYFYRQWQADRYSISPLILEAIFACSAQMLGHTQEAAQWLALASKHEECFKDVPRLSTLQGSLLLLKAREAVPRRGYYYRSWMSVVNLIAMAKDLELHEHLNDHLYGNPCGSHNPDCATKTRVWNCLFPTELYIGSSQGRTDYGVPLDSVDFDSTLPLPGLDEQELQISQQYTYLLRLAKIMREALQLTIKLRRLKDDWPMDPEFISFNDKLTGWYQALPTHLQISFPADESTPFVPFHFVANLHIYYNLCQLMIRRPQLQLTSGSKSPEWKEQMLICYQAAKQLCKLQEAVIQLHGMEGLLYMLRGINFGIFAVLTCTMVELIAITYPEPNISLEARDFFTRHMRILERCSKIWTEPEMQAQIDSLRQAFTADMTKPFELRHTFPLGSPGRSDHSSPPLSERSYLPPPDYGQVGEDNNISLTYGQVPITPPPSADHMASSLPDISAADPTIMVSTSQTQMPTMAPSIHQTEPQVAWNPARIFDQWTQAFGTPARTDTSGLSPSPQAVTAPLNLYTAQLPQDNLYATYGATATNPTTSFNATIPDAQQQQAAQQSTYVPVSQPPVHSQAQPASRQHHTNLANAIPTYVTPSMWRDAVQSSFGSKRRWNEAHMSMDNSAGVKRMR